MTSVEPERSVLSLIRKAVDEATQPDSAAIAEQVLIEMNDEQLRRLAESGVRSYVGKYLGLQRVSGKGNGSNGSARWDQVKAEVASGELDLVRYSVYTGKSRKWLLDCNVADLHDASDWHRDRGDQLHAVADAMDGLANTLKRKQGAEVVGDLPEQKVRGLLSA